ncbi:MAG: amidohydrolase [Acidimicrobiales bacterium]|nr:amidohydrolase [Acidimicrobiales bacterium]
MFANMISADSHVVEPLDLWNERLPSHLVARAPKREMRGSLTIIEVEGQGPVAFTLQTRLDGSVVDQDCVDLARRLEDVESDGIWGEVVYPNLGLSIYGMPDGELAMASAMAYNDWISDAFAEYRDRFVPVGLVPLHSVDAALAEIRRAEGLGLRTVMLPIYPPAERPYTSAEYEPIWAYVAERQIPLSFHAATGKARPPRATIRERDKPDLEAPPGTALVRAVQNTHPAEDCLAALVGAGVLERFPELQIVFSEVGAGWMGTAMVRMDAAVDAYPGEIYPHLPLRPSDYVRRQVHTTFMDADHSAIRARHYLGVGNLMWGADYPHREGCWPRSRVMLENLMADVPADEVELIVQRNVADVYGISLPAAA